MGPEQERARLDAQDVMTAGAEPDERAEHAGAVAGVVPAPAAHAAAGDLSRELAQRPVRALALAKECVLLAPSAEGYEFELTASRELYGDPETIDLLTKFLNRRKSGRDRKETA